MAINLTPEQSDAIKAQGKVIVSASAGSGKTFVMIQKLSNLIESGGDLDEVLAVTFTKKAAAQMKEKLRASLIERLGGATEDKRSYIKTQLNKIPSADISTIHSFCSHLIRTYFYCLDIDSSFEIIADEDCRAASLKNTAMEELFDRLYEEENKDFALILSLFRKKRSDESVKKLILEGYNKARITADYRTKLAEVGKLYTEEGFEEVCRQLHTFAAQKAAAYLKSVDNFERGFCVAENGEKYAKIFEEMRTSLQFVIDNDDIFAPLPPFTVTRKPTAKGDDKAMGDAYSDFRDDLKGKYDKLYSDLSDRQTELKMFLASGEAVKAFCNILLDFDEEYTAVKREDGKLDYNDLEHLTLKLLQNDDVRRQINAKYKYVFVDEYQDVNPLQESILSKVGGGEVFTVGDVKQAIYGFRGSRSAFFTQKYNEMRRLGENALKLSNNFRSSDGVVNFVNELFSSVMTAPVCPFEYRDTSVMVRGGGYPEGYGEAGFYIFGKDDNSKEEASGVYSVAEHSIEKKGHTKEGLAVLEIVKKELSGSHYDLKTKEYVPTQPGDICVLTRKRAGKSVTGIVRALTDAGYSVAGSKENNLCARAEIKEMLDILSFIDNAQQDIPLVTALCSPVGGISKEELAKIRIAIVPATFGERYSFRECALAYATTKSDELAHKLAAFYKKIYNYRRLSDLIGAASLIDKIVEDCAFAANYSYASEEKMAGIRRLAEEAMTPLGELSLNAFLSKIKAGGYRISAPASASSDSIKVMTMHSSKGLEFPVVIIADIASSFKGDDYSDMPYDDDFGFAPKYYDSVNKLTQKTVLRRLCLLRAAREDLKNELNLFYVACTRAMCKLYIMSAEVKPFEEADVLNAECYADLCDIARYSPHTMPEITDFDGEGEAQRIITAADKNTCEKLATYFMKDYKYAESVNLPVKSSASSLLKLNGEDEAYYAENVLVPYEETDKTSAERGTAYHRFLELCDFAVSDKDGVEKQLEKFVADGLMPKEQADLLNVGNLCRILSMPAFKGLAGAHLMREQEFLVKLPAKDILQTSADDGVLLQGAIDLLATGKGGTSIIDYKYSKKNDEQIIKTYSRQLALYKKAVSKILAIDEATIKTTIINIYALREIPINV